jgi:hypothetical protein
MSIARVKASSLTQGLPKQKTMLAGNSTILPGVYESIQTVTVGAGGTSSVSFTSIPSTYKHLQVRAIARGSAATTSSNGRLTINNDTNYGNYYEHGMSGNGSSAGAGGYDGANGNILSYQNISNTGTASVFTGLIVDILDYANTSKYKTTRTLYGFDGNGSGFMGFTSLLYKSTSAISTLKFDNWDGGWTQYSSFALYGIK